jgi:hypothetical protein
VFATGSRDPTQLPRRARGAGGSSSTPRGAACRRLELAGADLAGRRLSHAAVAAVGVSQW